MVREVVGLWFNSLGGWFVVRGVVGSWFVVRGLVRGSWRGWTPAGGGGTFFCTTSPPKPPFEKRNHDGRHLVNLLSKQNQMNLNQCKVDVKLQ